MASLAARQHGVVSHEQLRRLGLSPASIARAAQAGRLHGVDRGVYAVGHPAISQHGRCLAAVLGCGRGAALSHSSAAWLWGLMRALERPPEVTLPRRGHAKATVRMHHSTTLGRDDFAVVEEIRTTAVARTLLDLAATVRTSALESAVERGERLAVLDLAQVDELLARCGAHPGRRRLRDALAIYRPPVFSRSRYERLFLAILEAAGLPRPAFNTFVAGHEIDAYWERERFAVEVDGWDAHRTRTAFERDPIRQEELKLAGIDSIRITARRIESEPKVIGKRLAILLEQRRQLLNHGPPTPDDQALPPRDVVVLLARRKELRHVLGRRLAGGAAAPPSSAC